MEQTRNWHTRLKLGEHMTMNCGGHEVKVTLAKGSSAELCVESNRDVKLRHCKQEQPSND